jgi:hypothetical protein
LISLTLPIVLLIVLFFFQRVANAKWELVPAPLLQRFLYQGGQQVTGALASVFARKLLFSNLFIVNTKDYGVWVSMISGDTCRFNRKGVTDVFGTDVCYWR